jgi:adenine-specific DNA-methyltransferase
MFTNAKLGQYFTTNPILKETVSQFILNNPSTILEPCIGQGDLVEYITDKMPTIQFDMYEIDATIPLKINKDTVTYTNFMTYPIDKKYKTIIGNPPYVRTRNSNLYIDFTEKCYGLLEENGEIIFIVPSDFLKLTSAATLLNTMMTHGTFTHIFHPHNEKMFINASIDIIVFRYCKNPTLEKRVLYNEESLYITNSNGLITFNKTMHTSKITFEDYFDIYVGLVTGKDEVYKNESIGNINVLNGEKKEDKYIYIDTFPCKDDAINTYLLDCKQQLMERKIKKFNEKNWFEWGRNIKSIEPYMGQTCIYIYNLTRTPNIAFIGNVQYFGGSLLMLRPKKECNLHKIVNYLNSDTFKTNFIFSGRFKIGHRQICNSYIPDEHLF